MAPLDLARAEPTLPVVRIWLTLLRDALQLDPRSYRRCPSPPVPNGHIPLDDKDAWIPCWWGIHVTSKTSQKFPLLMYLPKFRLLFLHGAPGRASCDQ